MSNNSTYLNRFSYYGKTDHEIAREKWSNQDKTKDHPKACKNEHSFCNFDYEWSDDFDFTKKKKDLTADTHIRRTPNNDSFLDNDSTPKLKTDGLFKVDNFLRANSLNINPTKGKNVSSDTPINACLPNVELPKLAREEQFRLTYLSKPTSEYINIKDSPNSPNKTYQIRETEEEHDSEVPIIQYQNITEEDLDDWIAQSLNRNLTSLLNPQKKYHIPSQLQDDFRQRYKNRKMSMSGQDSLSNQKQKSLKKPFISMASESAIFQTTKKSMPSKVRKNKEEEELYFPFPMGMRETNFQLGHPTAAKSGDKSLGRYNIITQNLSAKTELHRQFQSLHSSYRKDSEDKDQLGQTYNNFNSPPINNFDGQNTTMGGNTFYSSSSKISNHNQRKKNGFEGSDLCFNYKMLEPKNLGGKPIKVREFKYQKLENRRRNAVILKRDIHYGRLLKDLQAAKQESEKSMSKQLKLTKNERSKVLTEGNSNRQFKKTQFKNNSTNPNTNQSSKNELKSANPIFGLTEQDSSRQPKGELNMFYSYNLENLKRKSCYEKVANSITEQEFSRLKDAPKDFLASNKEILGTQQQVHEEFRQKVFEKGKVAEKLITDLNQNKTDSKKNQDRKGKSRDKRLNSKSKIHRKLRTGSSNDNGSISNAMAKSIGRDKVLEQKVLALLNDMQVMSEGIDMEMSQLNIHLEPLTLKMPIDGRPQSKWVLKAQQKLSEGSTQLSIDCYKQALIIQPEFFIPIYNIAVLLQKQKMYKQSKKWFQVCKLFEIDQENVKFGCAIIALKQLNFQESHRYCEELIEGREREKKRQRFSSPRKRPALQRKQTLKSNINLESISQTIVQTTSNSTPGRELVYYYMRSLCWKKLGNLEAAKKDYQFLLKNCQPSNYNFLSNYLISIVYSKSRRLKLRFDSLSYLNFRQTLLLIGLEKTSESSNPANTNLTQIQKEKSNDPMFLLNSLSHGNIGSQKRKSMGIVRIKEENEPLVKLVNKLISKRFFKRFSIKLVQKLFDNSEYGYIKANSLIFVEKHETIIILNGLVVVNNHSRDFQRPDNIAILQQGGIIGCDELDHNLCEKANNWFMSSTDVEILKINRRYFHDFWKGQITFSFDFNYNFLKNVGLFKGLSESTLFNLCELIQKVEYEKGTILYNDCSYRNNQINKSGVGFGLGKTSDSTDERFVNGKRLISGDRKKGKYQLLELIRKHIFKINEMKFNRLKYPGLFILISGKIEIEDDRGFRCEDIITEREYFGEGMLIDSNGFHKYGRMVVASERAELFLLPVDKMIWTFTKLDRQLMKKNSEEKTRKSINTLNFLRRRFEECIKSRIYYKKLLEK